MLVDLLYQRALSNNVALSYYITGAFLVICWHGSDAKALGVYETQTCTNALVLVCYERATIKPLVYSVL